MPQDTETAAMSRRRGLLTDRERELIADEDAGNQRYVAISRVRTKIEDELTEDIAILDEHHPDLLDELRDVVCKDDKVESGEWSRPLGQEGDDGRGADPDHREWSEPLGQEGVDVNELDQDKADVAEEIADVVSGEWVGENIDERREAAVAGVEWLREDGGPASGSDFKEKLHDRYNVASQSKDTWWRKTVRPAIQEAVDRGLAEYEHGRHEYEWIGGDGGESEPGEVYDPTEEF